MESDTVSECTVEEMEQKDFDRAVKVLHWNVWMMSMLGLGPRQRNDFTFFLNITYLSFFMSLEYLDLFLYIYNLEHVVMNLTENVAYTQIFVRITMLRMHNSQLCKLIADAMQDFDCQSYKTDEERRAFIAYNSRSQRFVKLLLSFTALTASCYYFTPVLSQLGSGLPELRINDNESEVLYILPYRIHIFYAMDDMRTYALTYAMQMPFVFVSGVGQIATDCLMVTLVFHVSGQMSVLSLRIKNLDPSLHVCRGELESIVRMHNKLLRMGKGIEEAFSVTLLAHLLGATTLLCVIGYQILTNFASGEKANLVSFLMFQFVVLLILYAHCTVGESLLTESNKVCIALYECKWYDMPVENARCIVVCMLRAQRPLCLKAGKFCMFCRTTLTSVLKTSMGYLSVLRSFL